MNIHRDAGDRGARGHLSLLSLVGLGLLALANVALASADQRACGNEPTDDLITYGDLISCTIDPASDQDQFRFLGAPGEVITISVTRLGGVGTPCFELLRPDGSTLSPGLCALPSRRINATLDQLGQHRIRVSEQGANQTVDYSVVLDRIAPVSPAAAALDPGADIVGVISPRGELDVFSFHGEVDDQITLVGTDTAGSAGPGVGLELFAPDGRLLVSATNNTQARINRGLTETGAYTLILREYTNSAPAFTYSLNYSCTGSCPSMALKRRYIQTASVADISGNDATEVVTLVQVADNGRTRLEVRDSATSTPVKTIWLFGDTVEPLGLAAVGDQTGDGVAEIAVLGLTESSGYSRVWVVDVAEGAVVLVRTFYTSGYAAMGISRIEDMNADLIPEIGVLAVDQTTNRKILRIRDGMTLDPVKNLILPN